MVKTVHGKICSSHNKKQLRKITTLVLYISITFCITGCGLFGKTPSGDHLEKLKYSENFNEKRNKFINQNHEEIKRQRQSRKSKGKLRALFFSKTKQQKPKTKLPEIKPDLEQFKSHTQGLYYIWLGHSTFLVNMNGKIILFDPVFSKYASPFFFINRRFQPPVIALNDLIDIDYIIISHDHYDHLDMQTIKYFVKKEAKFMVPLGVSSHLKSWGINSNNIKELDWWEKTTENDLKFIATPAQHFSGRAGFFQNKTLWASWIVQDKNLKIYFSGDSGYFTHFKEIGEKYGPFDITFLENGQYNKLWPTSHLFPEQTILAFKELKGKKLMTVHWGMFDISTHNWFNPIEESTKLSEKENIIHFTPMLGEVVNVLEKNKTIKWWKELKSSLP